MREWRDAAVVKKTENAVARQTSLGFRYQRPAGRIVGSETLSLHSRWTGVFPGCVCVHPGFVERGASGKTAGFLSHGRAKMSFQRTVSARIVLWVHPVYRGTMDCGGWPALSVFPHAPNRLRSGVTSIVSKTKEDFPQRAVRIQTTPSAQALGALGGAADPCLLPRWGTPTDLSSAPGAVDLPSLCDSR